MLNYRGKTKFLQKITENVEQNKKMDKLLKKNLLKTGYLILAAATIPMITMIMIAIWHQGENRIISVLSAILNFFYYGFSLFVLIYGSSQVIWKLPLKKIWRTAIFSVWLCGYPALVLAWLYFLFICLIMRLP